jgi:hypothetical protein
LRGLALLWRRAGLWGTLAEGLWSLQFGLLVFIYYPNRESSPILGAESQRFREADSQTREYSRVAMATLLRTFSPDGILAKLAEGALIKKKKKFLIYREIQKWSGCKVKTYGLLNI